MLKKSLLSYQNTLIAECHTNSQNGNFYTHALLQPDMFNEIWHILVVALNWCFTLTWSAIKLSTYIQVQPRQFLLPSPPLQEMYFLHVIWIWDDEGEWYCSCALGDSRSKPHIFPCDPIFFNSKHYHDVHCIQSLLDHGPSTKGGKRSKQSYSSPLISGQ